MSDEIDQPRKWEACSNLVRTRRTTHGGGFLVAECPPNTGHSVEDARLIAAAPDMLAALEKAVADYGRPGGPWNVPSEPGTWIAMARAAIATGSVVRNILAGIQTQDRRPHRVNIDQMEVEHPTIPQGACP